ncbi:MAG: hypothetical protein JNN20_15430 [Betaproteobacteria bacterium]|nr:hypothetical protein [Betaproteobacteria bacterium]
MFDVRNFLAEYARLSLLRAQDLGFYALRDVALVDLCLSWLAEFHPTETPAIMPMLLQGHLNAAIDPRARPGLAILRQYAPGLASRLSWRRAREEHAKHNRSTAFQVSGKQMAQRPNASIELTSLLKNTVGSPAPFRLHDLAYAKPGGAHYLPWSQALVKEQPIELRVPEARSVPEGAHKLRSRAINPPVAIEWDTLLKVAAEVDAREASPGFPDWMKPLKLSDRLQKVKIEDLGAGFMRNKRLTLEGVQHVVGMLSSGKSTLLSALMFALSSPGYDKKIGVIVRDTVSGAGLVARLKAHGISATLLSSFPRRDEHLSTLHWSTSRLDADTKLSATAQLTEMLGVACPLHGFNQDVDNPRLSAAIRNFDQRPCHDLKQGTSKQSLTCPLIATCPSQSAQQQFANSQVVVLTPQAMFWMTPDKTALREHISFPEMFQYTLDVILVDEADTIQSDLDKLCTQDQVLLSPNVAAFTASSIRCVTQAVNLNSGGQYASQMHVQWHRTLNRLQDSISAIYHLLICHTSALKSLTYRKPFTTASIFADIYLYAGQRPDTNVLERQATLEQIAVLASSLYRVASALYDDQSVPPGNPPGPFSDAFTFLSDLRLQILDTSLYDDDHPALQSIQQALESGCLSWLLPPDFGAMPLAEKKSEPSRYKRPQPANTLAGIARCIVLAMLANECLASYAYLVRHHSAVEQEFELAGDSAFREAKRIMDLYGHLLPRPMVGAVYGLLFEPAGDTMQGGVLRLVNHLGVGRYLLTHMNALMAAAHQAGPHALLLSGTSWAGGDSENASPTYDLQIPVAAILSQPSREREAIRKSRYELVSLLNTPTRVSGRAPEERRFELQRMATQLIKAGSSGQSLLSRKWDELGETRAFEIHRRRRAMLITNNYDDARHVAVAMALEARGRHIIYCLVPDKQARTADIQKQAVAMDTVNSTSVVWLPRSQIEEFGAAPEGSVLVAPLGPASRGHNIVTVEGEAIAAVSAIYFLHRPFPRPDDLDRFTGLINRVAHDICTGRKQPSPPSTPAVHADWAARVLRSTVDRGFALRASYQDMSRDAREQYAWDLLTSLWQTIGRGIRGGVPVYVAFCDDRFAPGLFGGKRDTAYSSCLVQICETLTTAAEAETDHNIARSLYGPFLDALKGMLAGDTAESAPAKMEEAMSHG